MNNENYQHGMYIVYKCSHCEKEFGEDQIPDLDYLYGGEEF